MQGIADLKYSPDNKFLAAATYDQWIDIYNVAGAWLGTRLTRFAMHCHRCFFAVLSDHCRPMPSAHAYTVCAQLPRLSRMYASNDISTRPPRSKAATASCLAAM